MSLFDAFKPKWQNSNPEKRLEAIAELGADNQDVLERIAESDTDASVRIAAVKKLSKSLKTRLNRVPRISLICKMLRIRTMPKTCSRV